MTVNQVGSIRNFPVSRRGRGYNWGSSWLHCGLVVGLVGLLAPGKLWGQEISLLKSTKVSGSIITLGQVADIQGGSEDDRRTLRQLPLRPYAAERPYITVQEVREALIADGWNLLFWEIVGSSRVQLQTSNESVSNARQLSAVQGAANQSHEPNRLAVSTVGQAMPTTHPAAQRTGVVQAQWREELADSAWEREPQINARGRRQESTSLVWVFKQDMHRGQIVTSADLEQVVHSRTVPSGAITDPEQIIGQVLRSTVSAGRPILANHLEPVKHVQRGKEVRLVSRIGEIEVSTTARCLADGTNGQTVTVESLDRKRQYLGQVIGFNTVQVVSNDQVRDGAIVAQTNSALSQPAQRPANRIQPNTLRR